MSRYRLILVGEIVASFCTYMPAIEANDLSQKGAVEQAKQNLKAVVMAYNSGDAKLLVDTYAPDIVNTFSDGTTLEGREMLRKSWDAWFKGHPGEKLNPEVQSAKYVADDVLVAQVSAPGTHDDPTPRQIIYVYKQYKGKWLAARIWTFRVAPPRSN